MLNFVCGVHTGILNVHQHIRNSISSWCITIYNLLFCLAGFQTQSIKLRHSVQSWFVGYLKMSRCWSIGVEVCTMLVSVTTYVIDRFGQCCPGSHIQRSVVSVDNDQSWPLTHRPCTIHHVTAPWHVTLQHHRHLKCHTRLVFTLSTNSSWQTTFMLPCFGIGFVCVVLLMGRDGSPHQNRKLN